MIKVGVLRGGTGEDYFDSLEKGGQVISYIQEHFTNSFQPVDILIDREGIWHHRGLPVLPADLKNKIDVIWHAGLGTDKNILESLSIPHIAPPRFASSVGGERSMLAEHMKMIGVQMPQHIVLTAYTPEFDGPIDRYATKKAMQVFEKFSSPWIVKSFTSDVSLGIHIAKTFPELTEAILEFAKSGKSILVEELIAGKKASVHSLAHFRGEPLYSFPPVEHRMDGVVAPGNFSQSEKEKVLALAKTIFTHLGAEHYMQADFIIHPNRGVIFTSGVFTPHLAADSHLFSSADAVGATPAHIFEHIINNALK